MTKEPDEWVLLQRRSSISGGGLVYIDADCLGEVLKRAGIPYRSKLKVRRVPLKGPKGEARIMLVVKEMKE